MVPAAEPITDAAVEIAEIEATRDVKLAQISAGTEEAWRDARIAELEGQMRGMREMLDRLTPPAPEPDPEPVPVVVTEPEPEPVPVGTAPEPPPVVEPVTTKTKKASPWW